MFTVKGVVLLIIIRTQLSLLFYIFHNIICIRKVIRCIAMNVSLWIHNFLYVKVKPVKNVNDLYWEIMHFWSHASHIILVYLWRENSYDNVNLMHSHQKMFGEVCMQENSCHSQTHCLVSQGLPTMVRIRNYYKT